MSDILPVDVSQITEKTRQADEELQKQITALQNEIVVLKERVAILEVKPDPNPIPITKSIKVSTDSNLTSENPEDAFTWDESSVIEFLPVNFGSADSIYTWYWSQKNNADGPVSKQSSISGKDLPEGLNRLFAEGRDENGNVVTDRFRGYVTVKKKITDPNPPSDAVLVGPGDSPSKIFQNLGTGKVVSFARGAVYNEELPVPPDGTKIVAHGSGPRPKFLPTKWSNKTINNVSIDSIHMEGNNDGHTFYLGGKLNSVKVSNSKFDGLFQTTHGVVFEDITTSSKNITFDGNIVVNYRPDPKKLEQAKKGIHVEPKAIGLFIRGVNTWEASNNIFAFIGARKGERTVYSQAVYGQNKGTSLNATVKNNLFLEIGAAAWQLRSGGNAENNIVIKQSDHSWVGEAGGNAINNLIAYSVDIDVNPLDGNLKRGGGLLWQGPGSGIGNQVYHKLSISTTNAAFKTEYPAKEQDLILKDNLVGKFEPVTIRADKNGIKVVNPPAGLDQLEPWILDLIKQDQAVPDLTDKINSFKK